MLAKLLYLLVVIFTVEAINIDDILTENPELQKCIPTFQTLDASGKFPSGLSSGNFLDIGNFDQCLNIDEINNQSEPIKGKYCLFKLALPKKEGNSGPSPFLKIIGDTFMKYPESDQEALKVQERIMMQGKDPSDNSTGLILGWCLPHTCPIDKLSEVLTSVLHEIHPEMKFVPNMGGMCQTKEDLNIVYDTSSIILITFLALTLLLMVVSTLYDMVIRYHKKKPAHIILIAFSVRTNGEKLLSISNNPDQLPCLNGIRFLSMAWVVYGHRYMSVSMGPLANLTDILDWMRNPANMYLINAPVSVDSFLVLSGVLLAYGYCLAKDKGVKFNIVLFYIHRYLRLTPVLAVVIWFHATIIRFFGSGPFWPFTTIVLQDFCIDNWWTPLVYIQNYYHTEEACIGQLWYLAVDMQLFILSPIILIPLWKWPKLTLLASTVLVLGSIASSFTVTYINDLSAFVTDFTDSVKYMSKYYYTTHTRYGPWLMGLMLGYYLFKLKKNRNTRITLHPAQVTFGWIVGMGLLLSTLFAGYDLMLHPEKLGNSFFNGFHRHAWTLGLCWVIFACTQGYGGPVNTFLSWSLFQILGRFTYTIYLVHLSLMYILIGSSRTNSHFSDFNTMHAFWGDMMFSLAISICLTLAYESPMVTIEKVLFKTGHKPKKPELPVHQNLSTSQGGPETMVS